MIKKIYRILGLIILFISLFFLGLNRNKFFFILENIFNSIFPSRKNLRVEKYPTSIEGIISAIQYSNIWLGTVIYIVAFALHAAIIIFLIYKNKHFAKFTLLIYSVVTILCFSLVFVGNMLGNYSISYSLSRDLKHLLQSPFFIILLICAFKLFNSTPIAQK